MKKDIKLHQELTISIQRVLVISLYILLLLILLTTIPYLIFWKNDFLQLINSLKGDENKRQLVTILHILGNKILILVLVYSIGIFVHEFLHVVVWLIAKKNAWKGIKFGFSKTAMSPYVHFNQPITAHLYRISLLLPAVIMGFIPLFLGFILGNFMVYIFGFLFTHAASGDLAIFFLIRKIPSKHMLLDHDKKIGCYLL